MESTAIARRLRAGEPAELPAPRRFSAGEYISMAEAGIFGPDERLELLEGEIIRMAAIGSRHARCVNDTAEALIVELHGKAIVSIQNAVRLSDGEVPQPDLTVLRLRPDRYDGALPGPEDVLLLIEVSDTTLRFDRNRKLPLYAQPGIPEVWIVDLNGKRVLVFRAPRDGAYAETTTVRRGGTLSPLAFPERTLPAAQLLG
jgi:Uma2 family endonuclease